MFKVKKTSYGFRLTISGKFKPEDMQRFQTEIESIRTELPEVFSSFVDARELIAFDQESKTYLKELAEEFQQMGCHRHAIILKSPVVSTQFRQLAFEMGNDNAERLIDAIKYDNWEQLGLDWVINGIEPAENPCLSEKQPQVK